MAEIDHLIRYVFILDIGIGIEEKVLNSWSE